MTPDLSRIRYLLQRYKDNTCTREEFLACMRFFEEGREDPVLLEWMEEEWVLLEGVQPEPKSYDHLYPVISEVATSGETWASGEGIVSAETATSGTKPVTRRIRRAMLIRRAMFLRMAASILLVLGLSLFYFNRHRPVSPTAPKTKFAFAHDVAPGGNKATLTLANGSTILLDSAGNGTIARQGQTGVVKRGNGRLEYNLQGDGPSRKDRQPKDLLPADLLYNTVATPIGGTYQIVLPDGSKVWLDAASSISFPVAFTGRERAVKLTGQAYFEVAKNINKPFNVLVGTMKVEVLGTHFNIMAYDNEESVRTTLIEGAVKVSTPSGRQAVPSPGEEVRIARDGALKVGPANMQEAIAWKDNRFYFHDADIHEVMRQLERWYHVKAAYNKDVKDRFYANGIPRNTNLSTVLKALTYTGKVQIDIEGERVIVQP